MRIARSFLFSVALAAMVGIGAPLAIAKDIVVGQVAPFGGPLAVSVFQEDMLSQTTANKAAIPAVKARVPPGLRPPRP